VRVHIHIADHWAMAMPCSEPGLRCSSRRRGLLGKAIFPKVVAVLRLDEAGPSPPRLSGCYGLHLICGLTPRLLLCNYVTILKNLGALLFLNSLAAACFSTIPSITDDNTFATRCVLVRKRTAGDHYKPIHRSPRLPSTPPQHLRLPFFFPFLHRSPLSRSRSSRKSDPRRADAMTSDNKGTHDTTLQSCLLLSPRTAFLWTLCLFYGNEQLKCVAMRRQPWLG
jgi:hypothetical protein